MAGTGSTGVLGIRLPLGPAEVRGEDDACAAVERNSIVGSEARIRVSSVTLPAVERHVEVDPNENAPASNVAEVANRQLPAMGILRGAVSALNAPAWGCGRAGGAPPRERGACSDEGAEQAARPANALAAHDRADGRADALADVAILARPGAQQFGELVRLPMSSTASIASGSSRMSPAASISRRSCTAHRLPTTGELQVAPWHALGPSDRSLATMAPVAAAAQALDERPGMR